ncbi:MAG TPA: hypothetical protein PKX31_00040 [Chitinophagaceae bacterium]|nr:hypothetical protein [Chitinophagaceae bacterium]
MTQLQYKSHPLLHKWGRMFDHTYVGKTYSNDLHFFTNKKNPDGRRVYVQITPEGYAEVINIYDGSSVRFTGHTKFQRTIDGFPYAISLACDHIFSCVITGLKETEDKTNFSFLYYTKNIPYDKDSKSFAFQDFELSINNNNKIEMLLPNFDRKIIGVVKNKNQLRSPEISWTISDSSPQRPFLLNDGFGD